MQLIGQFDRPVSCFVLLERHVSQRAKVILEDPAWSAPVSAEENKAPP